MLIETPNVDIEFSNYDEKSEAYREYTLSWFHKVPMKKRLALRQFIEDIYDFNYTRGHGLDFVGFDKHDIRAIEREAKKIKVKS